jgi:hypothetical protein
VCRRRKSRMRWHEPRTTGRRPLLVRRDRESRESGMGGIRVPKEDRPRVSVLLMIVGVTLVEFVALFGLTVCAWLLLLALGIPSNLWDMTQAVSTTVAAAAVFGAGFVAYRELGETPSSVFSTRWTALRS